jgi:hypothetical protein
LKNERVPCSSMTLRALPLWTALHIDHWSQAAGLAENNEEL